MKKFSKAQLKYVVAIIAFIIIIASIIYLTKYYYKTEKFTTNDEADNDNYFNIDTINKITNANLQMPTIKENNFKLPANTILPYYGDFTNENVIDLINNNYFPCDSGDTVRIVIENNRNEIKKDIGYNSYTRIDDNNLSAFYTINISLSNKIIVPDLRRMYLAGSGEKIKNNKDETHPSLNSDDEYIKGKIIGEEKHKLTIDEMPRHRHTFNNDDSNGKGGYIVIDGQRVGGLENDTTSNNRNTASHYEGGDKAHENRPPTVIVNYIMYVGELPDKA